MKQLTCELCGSNEIVKSDGIFVCQSCGCKYSVEEAKKLMGEETISVNRSNEVENKLKNAINAYDNGHIDTASSMCNDILDIDPENYNAIIYRALSDGWHSSVSNNRINNCSKEIERAIEIMRNNFSEDSEFTDNCIFIFDEMQRMGTAITDLYVKYNKSQQKEYNDLIASARRKYESGSNSYNQLSTASGVIGGLLSGSLESVASSLATGSSISKTNSEIRSIGDEYVQMAKQVDQERVSTYNNGCGNTCIALNNIAITILNNINEKSSVKASFYERIISFARSYKGFLTTDSVVKNYNSIVNICTKYAGESRKQEEKVKQERNTAYWNEHADEKRQINERISAIITEIADIETQLTPYRNDIEAAKREEASACPAEKELEQLSKDRKEIYNELQTLNIFQGKRKSELNYKLNEFARKETRLKEEIENHNKEHNRIIRQKIQDIEQAAKPLQDKIAALHEEKSSLEHELTKDR